MLAAHAEHEALLERIGAAFRKEAELDRRTEQARERAEAAEAARAVGRVRQAGTGTYAEGGGGVLRCGAGAAGRRRCVAEADGAGALPHLGGEGAGGRGGRRGRGARGGAGTAGARSDQAEHAKADDEQEGRDQADSPSDSPEFGAKAGDVGLRGGA